MAWQLEFSDQAQKNLAKLDKPIARRILSYLHERVAFSENPRNLGEALTGSELGEYWKYRIGDYRVICRIEDKAVRVVVVKIGNRREVYRV